MALADNLIAAWEMDEASGTRVDSHGTNDLTDNNTVGSGTGQVLGTAADFESDNSEYLSCADNADLSTGDIDFTFEFWINAESLSGTRCIAGKDTDTGRDYTIDYFGGGGGIRFYINGNVGLTMGQEILSTGTWYQVFAWHDAAADEIGIAVNAGTPYIAATLGTAPNDTGTELNIGSRRYPGNNDYFDGLIGPVRFWKRVLTSDERTELYNGGAGRDYAYIAGGAPGGLSIPIAMRHYLQMMGVG